MAREIKNGMVTPFSYVLAKSVLQVPIMFIWAVFALGQAYAIMDYYVANFGLMMVIFACYIYAWEAMAELLSVAFENPLLGMMQFMGLWFSAFLYGGFLIPGEDIYWPLKIFFYILPIKYTVRSMNYVDNIDAKFDGCAKYDDDEQFCFGQDALLKNVGSIYPLITDENTLSTDIGIVLAIAAFFKLQYIIILVVKSRAAALSTAPEVEAGPRQGPHGGLKEEGGREGREGGREGGREETNEDQSSCRVDRGLHASISRFREFPSDRISTQMLPTCTAPQHNMEKK